MVGTEPSTSPPSSLSIWSMKGSAGPLGSPVVSCLTQLDCGAQSAGEDGALMVRGTPSFSKALTRVSTKLLSIIGHQSRSSHEGSIPRISWFSLDYGFDFPNERTKLLITTWTLLSGSH